jgi:hypothetical protein
LSNAAESIGSIRLTIISDGEFRNYIENIARTNSTECFTTNFKGEVAMTTLPAYLLEKIDMLFAMGTSALEGARLGVPVFLADYSYQKIARNYRFKHFFNNSEYSLGEEIGEAHYEDTSSLELSLQTVIDDYEKYSRLSYDFWAVHFSVESAKEILLQSIDETTATFGEMANLGFFQPDFPGKILRSVSVLFRKDLSAKVVGFFNDC